MSSESPSSATSGAAATAVDAPGQRSSAILEILHKKDPAAINDVMAEINAMGQSDKKALSPILLKEYPASTGWYRIFLLRAINNLKIDSKLLRETLPKNIQPASPRVKVTEACVLASAGDPQGISTLIALVTDKSLTNDQDELYGFLSEGAAEEKAPLANNDVYVRDFAATCLGETKEDSAVDPLITILLDRSEHIRLRWEAASSLGKLKGKRAMQPLREIIESEPIPTDPDSQARDQVKSMIESAMYALAQIGTYEVSIDMAKTIVNEQVPLWKKATAIRALGICKDKRSYLTLRDLLNDQTLPPELRQAAYDAARMFQEEKSAEK
jgi:HEAT repeat protein